VSPLAFGVKEQKTSPLAHLWLSLREALQNEIKRKSAHAPSGLPQVQDGFEEKRLSDSVGPSDTEMEIKASPTTP
jgi:hypothetical protein